MKCVLLVNQVRGLSVTHFLVPFTSRWYVGKQHFPSRTTSPLPWLECCWREYHPVVFLVQTEQRRVCSRKTEIDINYPRMFLRVKVKKNFVVCLDVTHLTLGHCWEIQPWLVYSQAIYTRLIFTIIPSCYTIVSGPVAALARSHMTSSLPWHKNLALTYSFHLGHRCHTPSLPSIWHAFQISAKAAFDFGQRQYTVDVYQSLTKVAWNVTD